MRFFFGQADARLRGHPNDLQWQVSELRGDVLDESERRIEIRKGAQGAAPVVIGVGGLRACAKFRPIAEARRQP